MKPLTFHISNFTGWLEAIINDNKTFPKEYKIFLVHNSDEPAGKLFYNGKNEWTVVSTTRHLRDIKYDLLKVIEKHFDVSDY
jgi:hypothetical protein